MHKIRHKSLALWHIQLNLWLQQWYTIWTTVQTLAVPFLIQLLLNVSGKSAKDGSDVWAPAHKWNTKRNSGLLSLTWPSPTNCIHLSLSYSVCNTALENDYPLDKAHPLRQDEVPLLSYIPISTASS